ncbi:MAG TPA: altronate dehydratase family protein [Gammaproteobacteria bacterium]|nr:altronate dehydratase family protein [Gammaproteobacteria bacterium]
MCSDSVNTPTIRLHPDDNVVIARTVLDAGTAIPDEGVTVTARVPAAHKVAARPLRRGDAVYRYGQPIGTATRDILGGEHVHLDNLAMADMAHDYAFCRDARPTDYEGTPATFQGFVRRDGRVGTRNYIGVISSVNCSATVCHHVANTFLYGDGLAGFPNVDGVVAITHGSGCGMADSGEGFETLKRTLQGYARQPNFGAVLLIGLGCEVMQIGGLLRGEGIESGPLLRTMTIQHTGGTRRTVQQAVARIHEMLPEVNRAERQSVAASELCLALQCGGSDGYSGITANPALGAAVDRLVRHGGTAILSETPEIYGAEHLLTRRAVSAAVGEKLLERIRWWERYTERMGAQMNNNPSPGNKAGGITTIVEKSLGAVTKGGTTNLVDVYEYAEPVTARGLVYMDTPGYDPVSATGQIAGGANAVCFTTGRGSAFGAKPSPSIKLATNSAMFEHQTEDMDINCGGIATGEETVDACGERIFRRILAVASGERTRSEDNGYGDSEFVPWQLGATM